MRGAKSRHEITTLLSLEVSGGGYKETGASRALNNWRRHSKGQKSLV